MYEKAKCITCHIVRGQGTDFGPDLSEIGDKLSREAMLTSILDPSFGILKGYEGVLVEHEGGEVIEGYVIGETADALTMRLAGGVRRKVPKSEIQSREVQEQSLMTPGLQRALTEHELVDLIEFLATLRRK